MADDVGTDEEITFPLKVRDRLSARGECICWGLPVCRTFPVIIRFAVFPDRLFDLVVGLGLLFLRSKEGMAGFPLLSLRPVALDSEETGLPLSEASKIALMS